MTTLGVDTSVAIPLLVQTRSRTLRSPLSEDRQADDTIDENATVSIHLGSVPP
jgi:hypothetical protein